MSKNDTGSELFKKILKRCSLETRLRNMLQMADYENWDNGEYSGTADSQLQEILDEVWEWRNDHAPLRDLNSSLRSTDTGENNDK